MDFRFWKRWKTIDPVESRVVSSLPHIEIFADFLSGAECDHIIALAKPLMEPSTLSLVGDYSHEMHGDARTSWGAWLKRGQDKIISDIEKKISECAQIPVERGEKLQVLRYEKGQEYRPHYDTFDPKEEGSSFYLESGGQRVVTMLMYLSDVEEGGETTFPKLKVKVRPRRGAAVLFHSTHEDGSIDKRSIHGAAPVIKGVKWSAPNWFRQYTFESS